MSNKPCLSHHWAKASLLLWWVPFCYFLGLLNVDIFPTWDKPLYSFTCYFAVLCMILFIDTVQVVSDKSVSFLCQRIEVPFVFYKQCLLIFESWILLSIWWKPSRYYICVSLIFYVWLHTDSLNHIYGVLQGQWTPFKIPCSRKWKNLKHASNKKGQDVLL